jgi:hypothetical protein
VCWPFEYPKSEAQAPNDITFLTNGLKRLAASHRRLFLQLVHLHSR